MIDQKAAKKTRLLDILWWLKSRSNAQSYDVWRWWAGDSRRQRVSSDTITKDLQLLRETGYVVRSSEVTRGCRTYHFSITSSGLRVLADREEGRDATLRL